MKRGWIRKMSEQSHPAFEIESEQVDTRALAQQLGSAEELTTLSPHAFSQDLTRIHSLPVLRDFLLNYKDNTLALHEFDHIYMAWSHATRNELRELIELDNRISADPAWKPFMASSHNVGKRQLNKMRLLKDDRFIQRYRKAVQEGRAYAWHTVVYGIILATYSIPLRQGLLHYGRKTIGGFIASAARSLDLTENSSVELHNELYLSLPPVVEGVLLSRNGTAIKLLS
jgi:urease accessory protein UreF